MALCVAAYHFSAWTHPFAVDSRAKSLIAVLGIYSVQGFFIISGLCFFHVYRERTFGRRDAHSFYVKRFFRIAPLYYCALALNLSLGRAVWPAFSWQRIAENVSLTFGLFHPNHAMVLGGWSIGIECVFYLAFPLLLLAARSGPLLLALSVVCCAFPWLGDETLRALPESTRFHAYVRISNHAFLFLLGGLCARLAPLLKLQLSARTLLALAGLALFLLLRWLPPVYDHFDLMVGRARLLGVSACFVVVLVAALGRVRSSRGFAPFRVLGDLSYAVYLLHPFAWLALEPLHIHERRPALAFAAGLALSLALAWIVHIAIERPLLRLGQRLSAAPVHGSAALSHEQAAARLLPEQGSA